MANGDDTGRLRILKRQPDSPVVRRKDNKRERALFGGRALIAMALALGAMLTLWTRLAYLQVVNHEHFVTLSDDNRVKLQPLPPTRGLIYDRNGVLLADNLPSYRLEITPEEVKDLDGTLARLRRLITISDQDVVRFERLKRSSPRYRGVPLRFRLSQNEVSHLAVQLHQMPGVDIRADLTRYYPLGVRAEHVIGYVGRIDEDELKRIDVAEYAGTTHIGKIGVERAYEPLLHGKVGFQQVETNAAGRVVRILSKTPPVPGRNLYLTLDMRLQKATEDALAGHTGAIVAIDPRNGDVLAMASMPSYDPNPFVNGIDAASYRALNESPHRPLFNRALRGQYPPGSTVKPIIGLGGLETGTINRNSTVYCPGFYRLPGQRHRFRDWRRGGHGTTDLSKGIAESCDVFYYDLAYKMGMERMHDYLGQFSLGVPTGIDLIGEKEGLVPSPDWKRKALDQPWYAGETLIAGIGQGYMLTSPLQLAQSTAILANRGEHFLPRVLHASEDPSTREVLREAPRQGANIPVVDPVNWEHVIAGMISVVHGQRGTARRIGEGVDYRIAGKTGTAQVFSLGQDEKYDSSKLKRELHDHALFVAFAPADDPRIALAVIVEHGGGGSTTAAPIARRVLDAFFDLESRS